jgi:hypothetical protein
MNGSEYGNSVDVPDEVDPRAERVLTQAGAAARRAGAEDFIGVEHIFLAILADEDAIPTQVMWIGRPGERSGELITMLASDGYWSRDTRVHPPDRVEEPPRTRVR